MSYQVWPSLLVLLTMRLHSSYEEVSMGVEAFGICCSDGICLHGKHLGFSGIWGMEICAVFLYISVNGSGHLWNLEVCANLSGIWRVL